MKIAIIGSGYVGLVTGACLAQIGNKVICVDNDAKKVESLKKGAVPIYEPGLRKLIVANTRKKTLLFSSQIQEAIKSAEIIFIAVGTPSLASGEADLTGIENVARAIALGMDGYRLVVEKSTVPVETGEWVKRTIAANVKRKIHFDVASNPEFLREGSAIEDFMHPDRIVIGVESKKAERLLTSLYRPFKAPIVVTNIESAELIKHASNAFLATKISFVNALSQVCERVGADVDEVAKGMGYDKRIGKDFLRAGLGYGGSCFPKDLDAFITIAEKIGYRFDLLKSVKEINEGQKVSVINKIKHALWIVKDKTIAVLGLSFKANTDDLRNAPALDIIASLLAEGARVRVFDPQAMAKAKELIPRVTFCNDAYDACRGADCLLLATEWDEFKKLDFTKVKRFLNRPLIIDGRNLFDGEALTKKGFSYFGMGKGRVA